MSTNNKAGKQIVKDRLISTINRKYGSIEEFRKKYTEIRTDLDDYACAIYATLADSFGDWNAIKHPVLTLSDDTIIIPGLQTSRILKVTFKDSKTFLNVTYDYIFGTIEVSILGVESFGTIMGTEFLKKKGVEIPKNRFVLEPLDSIVDLQESCKNLTKLTEEYMVEFAGALFPEVLAHAKSMVRMIEVIHKDDYEGAHSKEDSLRTYVLGCIATGIYTKEQCCELATVASSTSNIEFPRHCA